MATVEDVKKLKGQRFYSESLKKFVVIDEIYEELLNKINNMSEAAEAMKVVDDLVYESDTKHRLEKDSINSGKNTKYLIGKNNDGEEVWLASPSWDCGWYWGFGYLHTKNSLFHVSGLVGQQEYYDYEKQCFRKGGYVHNIYDSPQLIETAFSEKEGWLLSELFKQFYLLKDMAAFCHKDKPGCHVTTSPVDHGTMIEWFNHINTVMIPKITAEIIRILSPVEEVKDEKEAVEEK